MRSEKPSMEKIMTFARWTIQIEKSNWKIEDLPLSSEEIFECYTEAIQWSNNLLSRDMDIAHTS